MPKVSNVYDYDGFAAKAARLSLDPLVDEATGTLHRFELLVEETRHVNGTRDLRKQIDEGFKLVGGWEQLTTGGIDWTKRGPQGGGVGVEVQVSGRSDMLAVDIMHLKDKLNQGDIDIGIIIVPDDRLSRFLTDRTPNAATAIKHVHDRARDLPIRIIAFEHDGVGPALDKMRANMSNKKK